MWSGGGASKNQDVREHRRLTVTIKRVGLAFFALCTFLPLQAAEARGSGQYAQFEKAPWYCRVDPEKWGSYTTKHDMEVSACAVPKIKAKCDQLLRKGHSCPYGSAQWGRDATALRSDLIKKADTCLSSKSTAIGVLLDYNKAVAASKAIDAKKISCPPKTTVK